ncbi:hypothetical protein [Rhodococcus sp. LB1]|uniref:hypothetical protein n=1 Tax=Rhodococcus sp. LB1 TaxID=1807499 RepID=UPI001E4225A9|nr:hypothetical protein [Rhodococcus sp. LB1]
MPLILPCRFPVQVLPAPGVLIMTGSGPDQEPAGLAAGGVPGSRNTALWACRGPPPARTAFSASASS